MLACTATGLSACGASKRTATPVAFNPGNLCGSLSMGKGWVVKATSNVPCSDARSLMRRFIATPGDNKITANEVHESEGGYSCVGRVVSHLGAVVSCVNGTKRVSASSPFSPATIFLR
jgi:hypothetical protein